MDPRMLSIENENRPAGELAFFCRALSLYWVNIEPIDDYLVALY
jgi:hypothetical protein